WTVHDASLQSSRPFSQEQGSPDTSETDAVLELRGEGSPRRRDQWEKATPIVTTQSGRTRRTGHEAALARPSRRGSSLGQRKERTACSLGFSVIAMTMRFSPPPPVLPTAFSPLASSSYQTLR